MDSLLIQRLIGKGKFRLFFGGAEDGQVIVEKNPEENDLMNAGANIATTVKVQTSAKLIKEVRAGAKRLGRSENVAPISILVHCRHSDINDFGE